MVEAVITQVPPETTTINAGGMLAPLHGLFGFIGDHLLVFGILLILAVGVGYLIWWHYNKEEELREQEDMLYKDFKDNVRSCILNSDDRKYTKHWTKWNLLFLGLPIFHYKRGLTIRDTYNVHQGYYGGVYIDYLGNYNLLMWKNKFLFFFKDWFVLRCPTKNYVYREIKPKSQKQKEEIAQKDVKDYTVATHTLPDGLYVENMDTKTITIAMVSMKKHGYFFYPVYQDVNKRILDLQESINLMNKVNHSDVLLHNVIKEGGKQVLNMAKYNAPLNYEKQSPDKVKDIPKEDN
jgi:hypothetical protein